MEQALSDVRILDLTHYIAGPFCTRLLADYGADVIKIEKPYGGDPVRRAGPFPGDIPHPEKSGLFLHLNINKRGVTLNLKTQAGKKIFFELLKDADILVENFSPRVMPSLGLTFEELEKINPKLVMTSISNFGQTGPYRDFKASELILYGMGGAMNESGTIDRYPVKSAGNIVQYQIGTTAAFAAMTALFTSRLQGIGQQIDISFFETLMDTIDRRVPNLLSYIYGNGVTHRQNLSERTALAFGTYPCKDGFFCIEGGIRYWDRICAMIERPDLATDPGLSTWEGHQVTENCDRFNAVWYLWCAEHTKLEIVNAGQAAGLSLGPINTIEDLVKEVHWKERQFWVDIDHPAAGKLTYTGAPFKMTETPWQVKRPAPLLGEHNAEVYGKLGYSREDIAKLRQQGVI
jgi:crotonobetainyl-CoA:carnitine CoA-transferase CaiB-like acyl-CoA transferase